jgi:hypothetical protein
MKDLQSEEMKEQSFEFDKCIWSHDGFAFDQNRRRTAKTGSSSYCGQQETWQHACEPLLNKAWVGINSTLISYGPSGAGKTYTMMGEGPERGLVSITAEQIFKRTKWLGGGGVSVKLSFSMVEVYMDKISDLLVPTPDRTGPGLKVTHDSVEGAIKLEVRSYEEFD